MTFRDEAAQREAADETTTEAPAKRTRKCRQTEEQRLLAYERRIATSVGYPDFREWLKLPWQQREDLKAAERVRRGKIASATRAANKAAKAATAPIVPEEPVITPGMRRSGAFKMARFALRMLDRALSILEGSES